MSQEGVTAAQRGREVKRQREGKGLSAREVAGLADVCLQTVYNVEAGRASHATTDRVFRALAREPKWLTTGKTAKAIGISGLTVRRAAKRSMRTKFGRDDWPVGAEVTARICGCDVRLRFGGRHGRGQSNSFRCHADDVENAKRNHERLIKQLKDGELVEGHWIDRRKECWLTRDQADEIGISRKMLVNALYKKLDIASGQMGRRSSDELVYAIVSNKSRPNLRIAIYDRAVRVRVIRVAGFNVVAAYNRKDVLDALAAAPSTRFTYKEVVEHANDKGLKFTEAQFRHMERCGLVIDREKPDYAAIVKWRNDRKREHVELPILGADGKVEIDRETYWVPRGAAKEYAEHIRTAWGKPSKHPESRLRYLMTKAALKFKPVTVRRPTNSTRREKSARRNRLQDEDAVFTVNLLADSDMRRLLGLPPVGEPQSTADRPLLQAEPRQPEPVDEQVEAEQQAPSMVTASPEADTKPQVTINGDFAAIRWRGKTDNVSREVGDFVSAVVEANGWIKGPKIEDTKPMLRGTRIDRVKAKVPRRIQRRIRSNKQRGYLWD